MPHSGGIFADACEGKESAHESAGKLCSVGNIFILVSVRSHHLDPSEASFFVREVFPNVKVCQPITERDLCEKNRTKTIATKIENIA